MRHCKSDSKTRCIFYRRSKKACFHPHVVKNTPIIYLEECPYEREEREKGRFFVIYPSAYDGKGGYTQKRTIQEAKKVLELNKKYHPDIYIWDEMLQERVG